MEARGFVWGQSWPPEIPEEIQKWFLDFHGAGQFQKPFLVFVLEFLGAKTGPRQTPGLLLGALGRPFCIPTTYLGAWEPPGSWWNWELNWELPGSWWNWELNWEPPGS